MLAEKIGVSVNVARWKVLGWLVRATVEKETKATWSCCHAAVASHCSEDAPRLDSTPHLPSNPRAYSGR